MLNRIGDIEVVVRKFQSKDRGRVRDIARNTGQKGNPTKTYFEDDEVVPIVFTDYFMDYEPESCFVAEVGGVVIGYLVATKDVRRYYKVFWLKIIPRLILRFAWKILTFQYRKKRSYMTLWWLLARSWREIPRVQMDRYPARMHANLEPGYRNGTGTKLLDTLLNHFEEVGVRGVHGIFVEPEENRRMSHWFRRRFGFKELAQSKFSLWEELTGQRWVFKLVVLDLSASDQTA